MTPSSATARPQPKQRRSSTVCHCDISLGNEFFSLVTFQRPPNPIFTSPLPKIYAAAIKGENVFCCFGAKPRRVHYVRHNVHYVRHIFQVTPRDNPCKNAKLQRYKNTKINVKKQCSLSWYQSVVGGITGVGGIFSGGG